MKIQVYMSLDASWRQRLFFARLVKVFRPVNRITASILPDRTSVENGEKVVLEEEEFVTEAIESVSVSSSVLTIWSGGNCCRETELADTFAVVVVVVLVATVKSVPAVGFFACVKADTNGENDARVDSEVLASKSKTKFWWFANIFDRFHNSFQCFFSLKCKV